MNFHNCHHNNEGCRLLHTNCTEIQNNITEIQNNTDVNIGEEKCNYLFYLPNLSDQTIGIILLILSLVTLCASLMVMVKILNTLLQGSVAIALKVARMN